MESAEERRPRRPAGLGVLALCSSLLLNVLFLAHYSFLSPSQLLGDGGSCGLSWALQAAKEAEALAAADCSGHGQRGPAVPGALLEADAAASAVLVPGWHRLSYATTDGLYQSVELENHIRRLHRAVGNAVVDDKTLVFGAGSTRLINALVHALSPDADADASPPARVVATVPYYPPYRTQTAMFDGREYRWEGTTASWANASRNSSDDGRFVEFVTSPNNPDALLRTPVLRGSAVIADHAYYWPHFTHIAAPADEDVMLFTMSKPSGHAGSRLGWALVRDEKVAKRAYEYVQNSIMGASRDTQLRMLGIVKVMLANLHGKEDIFGLGHDVMRSRWRG
ncbi:unnamed protein product [Miscanthus lutarioriparius]|uniref:Alliinase C-terminal domain-containing protein n=1 Tax=Miscanthus lutarioriparius TaxID=422564 RepID=A0A811P0G9_9POAL|nr:unnamed protein product [Miscanthus lutarioriparius]